jgi:Z1 domain
MATMGLPLDPPPTEEDIVGILGRLKAGFDLSDDVVEEAKRMLHARFAIRMELGQTIVGEDEHEPWLAARKFEIDPFYWSRYREFLIRAGWSPDVVRTLDRALDEILDLLGNPVERHPWKRRGLVVGDVQSGKTATYAGLINKASDAGYRMVILLTGTLENVRRQTQERLDAAFVGFDSRDYLTTGQLHRKRHVGVGLINGERDGVVFTSRERDFRKDTATALNIALDSVRDPVLVVTKKNKSVLERLAGWLRARNADRHGRIDLPLLLIDDEADNASINTKTQPAETTAINRAIRDLLTLFTRSSYVGFTATPFANIFIDPDTTDEMIADDLFPRDFIHLLEPPTNYIGMTGIFPADDPEEDAGNAGTWSSGTGPIEEIDDEAGWLPANHGREVQPGPLPPSILEALRWFLLTCAIRDLRDARGDPHRGGGIHRSMLVNVSRFTSVQDRVAEDIRLEVERIQLAVRHHGAKPPVQAEASSTDVRLLRETFERHGWAAGFDWGDVLGSLHEAIASVQAQPVNQRTGSSVLDYGSIKAPPGVRVIAVGGNSLSRGITLEGLTVSYFLRNSKAYDTLLQMGRWFGYRDGYQDLCRIWLSPEAEGWYRHITLATTELKRDFRRMRQQRATPREFGLRVRAHPDTLIITARNKMATGMDITTSVQDVSLDGMGIETARIHRRRSFNEDNLRLIERFLTGLMETRGRPGLVRNEGAYLWQEVPGLEIAGLVEEFFVHPLNHDFQGDSIADHLRRGASAEEHPWSSWKIALPRRGTDDLPEWVLHGRYSLSVRTKRRRILPRQDTRPPSLLLSGSSARVGSRIDVLYGLSQAEEEEARRRAIEEAPDSRGPPEGICRSVMRAPLLVIFLVRGELVKNGPAFDDGLILPALGLHFPGQVDREARKRYVKYRLNRVAQAELDLGGDDIPVDEDIDD